MSSSFIISLPLLLSINLLISDSHTSEAAPIVIDNYCPDTETFLPYSHYHKNLNKLLLSLSFAAHSAGNSSSSSGGFANATADKYWPSRTYGIFLCRGDIDTMNCSDCVANAAEDIGLPCPRKRTSVIWYDICMLRYTNQPIYSVMQQVPVSTRGNGSNVTDHRSQFMQLLGETMDNLVRRAPSSGSGKKVAVVEAEVAGSQQLYTLAECTPELTASDCSTCLQSAVCRG